MDGVAYLLEQRPDAIRDLFGGTSVLLVASLAEDRVNTLVYRVSLGSWEFCLPACIGDIPRPSCCPGPVLVVCPVGFIIDKSVC
jgi:hypothetical protein